ncbi:MULTISPECIES: hypothetical protein [unclassified Mesorhizobium]|uniref:hypothetical protein n=1 Tax=unclassified Mesorhizobium TaxID=325217 RepID=UPI000FCBB086|nr:MULTISPECIES: hypothetical protein [unclassified Mesorhizobium]RUV91409.1 hypothetical protein EOA49_31985 [Mesorhizobium sp. M1A.F.Ca.IN.020.04.1.1]RUW00403.1 hypothetical protein EOA53_31615 [Mesorhizobium sp. M1A.F.Ca.IN.020.03.1.1]RWH25990.1 MAG: hypothetical protein EOQ76_18875 [Mesorhizobium sp.]RWH40222.1 MAG: hypothetical protein EOQ79_04245 [Mesorhizobium sp.]TIR60091.1 MAG: hypothetical protein E5X22_11220 [Mesorhizobium sp.]
MTQYRLEILEPPDERLRHRRKFEAPDDKEAIKRAHELYSRFRVGVTLDRYVLYDGDRVVDEYIESKR